MKEGWKIVKFSEVAQVVGGSTPKTNVKSFWNGDNYWVTPAELKGEKYINKTERTITDEAISKTNLTLLPKGTVLLSSRAPIGKVCITNVPMFCNQGFKNIVCKDSLYNEFVYYYLLYSVPYLESLGTGATFKEISKRVVENVEIPLPLLEEQHHIVSILDASFEKIDALKKNAEENLKNAKALFQQVLAQELKPKEGWVEKKLGEVVKHITDGDHQPPPKSNQGIPFITISNINKDNRTIDWRNTFYVPKEYFDGLKDDRKPKKGDILYTVTGSYGIPVLIDSDSEFCFQRHIAIIRPNKETVCSEFLYNWALSVYSKEQAEDTATGAAQKTVSLKSMRNFKISFPTDIEEQHRIVRTLDILSEKCRRLEQIAQQTIRECDALKQSILRQAFSGEL